MTDFVFNQAKGSAAEWARLSLSNDALIAIPLEYTGLEADSTLIDKDAYSDVISGATNEQATIGRKTLASVTVTIDDTNDRVDVDCADPVWTGATGNRVGAVVIVRDTDTTAGTDANLVPISKHGFDVIPGGGDITGVVPAGGFLRSS